MSTDVDDLFPDELSDEAASALADFLHRLAAACDTRYFAQLRRHNRRQINLYDPEAPWRSPPRKKR